MSIHRGSGTIIRSAMQVPQSMSAAAPDYPALAERIRQIATELGFQQVGISAADIGAHEQRLQQWLEAGYHGEM